MEISQTTAKYVDFIMRHNIIAWYKLYSPVSVRLSMKVEVLPTHIIMKIMLHNSPGLWTNIRKSNRPVET